jgi:hypothetical protein
MTIAVLLRTNLYTVATGRQLDKQPTSFTQIGSQAICDAPQPFAFTRNGRIPMFRAGSKQHHFTGSPIQPCARKLKSSSTKSSRP